ncbi:MAG: hypothetical protein OXC71_00650 [Chloroflexi bacterium]|nr:hypothetical protein [Chloroflexota bacterium]
MTTHIDLLERITVREGIFGGKPIIRDMPVTEKVAAMRDLIERHGEAMREGGIIVVTRSRVRIRGQERGEA